VKRLLLRGIVALLVALVLVVLAGGFYVRSELRASLPVLEGTRPLAGLSAPVTVNRDSLGVPSLSAASRMDLARAQYAEAIRAQPDYAMAHYNLATTLTALARLSEAEMEFKEALRLYWERERTAEGEPVWLEKKFDFKVGDHHVRGRVDRVDRLPDGDYELIDYKTGERKSEEDLDDDLQLALYRLAAREAWGIEASTGSYYYVLDGDKVAAPTKPDDAERVERTVLQVGEGILSQDFEPRPSPKVCGWCDYRLICPAAEA